MIKRFFLSVLLFAAVALPSKAATHFITYPLLSLWSYWESNPFFMAVPAVAETESLSAVPEIAADMELSFSTERVGEGALLKWDLPQPTEVSNLIIEGSEDGSHFIDLESLENVEASVLDVFYDASPKDRRYYRLVANYKDGKQTVTPVNSLKPANVFSAALAPENDSLLVVTGHEQVALYDMQGQMITTANPSSGKCELELSGLARGPYLVRAGADRQVVIY